MSAFYATFRSKYNSLVKFFARACDRATTVNAEMRALMPQVPLEAEPR